MPSALKKNPYLDYSKCPPECSALCAGVCYWGKNPDQCKFAQVPSTKEGRLRIVEVPRVAQERTK